jgi:SPP1 family predicted phage head-tail adaptor
MLAPKLRHRIDIEQRTQTQDSDGAVDYVWAVVHDQLPAEIVPVSGLGYTRALVAADQNQEPVTVRITVRYRSNITELMRVVHGSDVYNIKAVLPDPTLRRWLTLMCQKGLSDAGTYSDRPGWGSGYAEEAPA